MGAAAFIMAQFLGISYWEIVVAAAIPATLYFISIIAMVHFVQGKRGSWAFLEWSCECEGGLPRGVAPAASIVALVGFLATAIPR
jgi:TRAP-type uncharacterized transport system fused permease subunit